MADPNQLRIIKEGVETWNKWRSKNKHIAIDLSEANLYLADLHQANLTGAILENANLQDADLSEAMLIGANLSESNLVEADLSNAKLMEAELWGANLFKANLKGADLTKANLQYSNLVEAEIEQSILNNCKIYGTSVWGIDGLPKEQYGLILTPYEDPDITVDDLQMAQFIYLILDNESIRNVIDAITSKAVLILGRFTPERKRVLDLIRNELRLKYDLAPILFDFQNSKSQSLLETVMTLAGMSKFIIADITDATMVREELRSVIEKVPSKPVQLILLKGHQEFDSAKEMTVLFKNLLRSFIYNDYNHLQISLKDHVINPAITWIKQREAYKNALELLREENEELKKQNELLKQRLSK